MVCVERHLSALGYREGPGGGVVTLFLICCFPTRQIGIRLVNAAHLLPLLDFPNHTAVLNSEGRA
jgi:hypothetical protein